MIVVREQSQTLLFQQPVSAEMLRDVEPHVRASLIHHAESSARTGMAQELAKLAGDVPWRQILGGLSWRAITPPRGAGETGGYGDTDRPWDSTQDVPEGATVLLCRVRLQLNLMESKPAPVSYPTSVQLQPPPDGA